ncbi:hypothetical protein NRB_16330 [Novosphingobium sp. 11B]
MHHLPLIDNSLNETVPAAYDSQFRVTALPAVHAALNGGAPDKPSQLIDVRFAQWIRPPQHKRRTVSVPPARMR